MKLLGLFIAAFMASVLALPALASEFTLTVPEGAPNWLTSALVAFIGVCGVVSKLDAHIPETLKARLPRWLVSVWDFFGGNYLKSKNKDSA
ncbi:hypothetical protein [Vibrio sonorensis]|uniref:hypothetical protein n=1 Tax=Vibrio sonorensis TaxID=1004316 RepID=UPI0008DA7612|nr:hypothetical protein [Vibrio sonorensis]